MNKPKTPELDRLAAVSTPYNTIREFLEWLTILYEIVENSTDSGTSISDEDLAFAHLDIDPALIATEQALLEKAARS